MLNPSDTASAMRTLAQGLGNLELLARQLVEGFITGLHKSPYHGFSVEFAQHKAYNPGESLRYVDWKLYGRTDRLYTRQFEEETNLRCMLVLDASASMYFPEPGLDKLRFATLSAACLAYMIHRQRDAVGLTAFSDEVLEQTRIRSTSVHLHGLLASLEGLSKVKSIQSKGTDLPEVLHRLADQLGQRAMVVVLSDMLQPGREEEVFTALQHLRHNRHEVILFHITHGPTEVDLDLPDRDTIFIDAETGHRLEARPSEVKAAYTASVAAWHEQVRQKCIQNRIDLIEADTTRGVGPVLQGYLVKRQKAG